MRSLASVRDSIALVALVNRTGDTTTAVRDSVTASLRARSESYLPMLERWTHAKDAEFSDRAAAAVGRSGPAGHEIVRTFVRRSDFMQLGGDRATGYAALKAIPTAAEYMEVLEPLLTNDRVDVRVRGVWAIVASRRNANEFLPAYLRALRDSSSEVRAAAMWRFPHDKVRPSAFVDSIAARLVDLLDSPLAQERDQALGLLGALRPQGARAVPRAMRIAESRDSVWIREAAIWLLTQQRVPPRELVPILLRLLDDREARVRYAALRAVGRTNVGELLPAERQAVLAKVESQLSSYDPARMYIEAAEVLITLRARDELLRIVGSRPFSLQVIAIRGLSHFPDDTTVDRALLTALGQSATRRMAILALAGRGSRVEPELERMIASAPEGPAPTEFRIPVELSPAEEVALRERWAVEAKQRELGEAARSALRWIRAVSALGVADRCYAVTYGAWEPAIPAERVRQLAAPSLVRFRNLIAPDAGRGFVVEQQINGVWDSVGGWIPDTSRASLDLDGKPFNLSDVSFSLVPGGAGALVGEAWTAWDGTRDTQRARVRFAPSDCAPPPDRP